MKVVAAAALAALALSGGASAGRGLIVGVDDDWLKWTSLPDRVGQSYVDLKLGAVRVTLQWQRGRFSLDTLSRLYLRRVTAALPPTMRIVLSVYGPPRSAPRTLDARRAYCSFVGDAVLHEP